MNLLVFDIETVPDVETGRSLYATEDLDDEEVAEVMHHHRRQQTDGASDFIKHALHRVVAISVLLRNDDTLRLWSLGELDAPESELIRRFFDGIEQYMPILVSWNGYGFDLPVLHYRALLHGVSAPTYWDTGDEVQSFRWNNYRNRFHHRHVDLMDVLAGYQQRAYASLNDVARLLDLPGKADVCGADVWKLYRAGELRKIRDYCETDVLNTYLIYLRFDLMRGHLGEESYEREKGRVRELLRSGTGDHLSRFLARWPSAA